MVKASFRCGGTLALLLMLLLTACSGGEGTKAPLSRTEQLWQQYGIDAGSDADLPAGSRIVFFGDSITVGGQHEGGYINLVREALKTLYPDRGIQVLGSGVVGDKASDLTRRLSKDVLSKNPTHVVIYVGVNDVASLGPSRAALDAGAGTYRKSLTGLAGRISAAGARVLICTPGVIGEDVNQGTPTNYGLELFASTVRLVAAEVGASVCDLRSEFTQYLAGRNRNLQHSGLLTVDGIHLNVSGNRLVARTMLRALTGSEATIPTPFVIPTVSPRPKQVRPVGPARSALPKPAAETSSSPAAGAVSETEAPAASSSASPEPEPLSPSPVVRTPDGFPFETPSETPAE